MGDIRGLPVIVSGHFVAGSVLMVGFGCGCGCGGPAYSHWVVVICRVLAGLSLWGFYLLDWCMPARIICGADGKIQRGYYVIMDDLGI